MLPMRADNALLKMADLQKVEPLDTNDLEAAADKIAATATQVLLDVGPPFSRTCQSIERTSCPSDCLCGQLRRV